MLNLPIGEEVVGKYKELQSFSKHYESLHNREVRNSFSDLVKAVVDLSYLLMLKSAGWEKLDLQERGDWQKESGQWGGSWAVLNDSGRKKVELLIGDEVYYLESLDSGIQEWLLRKSIDQAIYNAHIRLEDARSKCLLIDGPETRPEFDFWLAQVPEGLKQYIQFRRI